MAKPTRGHSVGAQLTWSVHQHPDISLSVMLEDIFTVKGGKNTETCQARSKPQSWPCRKHIPVQRHKGD